MLENTLITFSLQRKITFAVIINLLYVNFYQHIQTGMEIIDIKAYFSLSVIILFILNLVLYP